MLANIKLSLYKLLPMGIFFLLENVIAKMTGNPLFTTPPVSYADMGTLRDELLAAIEDATEGSTAARAHRDEKLEEAKTVLRVTADYVRAECAGNAAKLTTSGFALAKNPSPVTEVGIPQRLVATATDVSGKVRLRWSRTIGAKVYRVEQAKSDPAAGEVIWNSIALVGRAKHDVTGLTSYAPNWFRVVAVGISSEGLPSDVVLGRAA